MVPTDAQKETGKPECGSPMEDDQSLHRPHNTRAGNLSRTACLIDAARSDTAAAQTQLRHPIPKRHSCIDYPHVVVAMTFK
eukprot:2233566-Alexandrium_andersonii.AAC.1